MIPLMGYIGWRGGYDMECIDRNFRSCVCACLLRVICFYYLLACIGSGGTGDGVSADPNEAQTIKSENGNGRVDLGIEIQTFNERERERERYFRR